MKRFFRRQPALPQTEQAVSAADTQTATLALAGAGELNRRRFARTLLVGLPAAGMALAATGPQTAEAASASDAWKLGGNSIEVTNGSFFLGTTDNTPLVLKTNKTERMRIREDGLVGIGTSPGGGQLAVSSSLGSAIRAETNAGAAAVGVLGIQSNAALDTAGVRGAHLSGGIGVSGTSDTSIGNTSSRGIGVKGTSTVKSF